MRGQPPNPTVKQRIPLQDAYRGCLIGLAVGDAVGTTYEFSEPGTFEASDMIGGGPFDLKPGQWTDDTSMALCLATSLVEKKGFDAVDQMERYIRWYKQGYMSSTGECFDIGNATRFALDKFVESDWKNPYCGSVDHLSAGNGSIMRLAPIPMAFRGHPLLSQHAADSSRTTHGHNDCIDSCVFLSAVIAALMTQEKSEVLSSEFANIFITNLGHFPSSELGEIIDGSYRRYEPPFINGKGHVLRTLEAALWAFYKTDNFRDGCLKVVNLGWDTDTTAAVYGQIAGAYYGVYDIPLEWVEKISLCYSIYAVADHLLDLNAKLVASGV